MGTSNSKTSEVPAKKTFTSNFLSKDQSTYPIIHEILSDNEEVNRSRKTILFCAEFINGIKIVFHISKEDKGSVISFLETLKENDTEEVLIKYLRSQGFMSTTNEVSEEIKELINGL